MIYEGCLMGEEELPHRREAGQIYQVSALVLQQVYKLHKLEKESLVKHTRMHTNLII